MPDPQSSDYEWKTKDAEYFHLLAKAWDVSRAKQMIANKPREVVLCEIAPFATIIGDPPDESGLTQVFGLIRVDWVHALSDNVKLDVPLILTTMPGSGHMLIDGWHRVAKAKLDKLIRLPTVVLTERENRQIMIQKR